MSKPTLNQVFNEDPNEDLLQRYVDFCVEKIRDVLIAFKRVLGTEVWRPQSSASKDGILTVTFINGILNVIRLLIENGKVSTIEEYVLRLNGLDQFKFNTHKSSQYRKMGEDLYKKFFQKEIIESKAK